MIWVFSFVRPTTTPYLDTLGTDPNAQLGQIVDVLDEAGITRVYGSYWAVLPVDFAGDNRIVSGVFPFWPIRFPDRQRIVGATPPPRTWRSSSWRTRRGHRLSAHARRSVRTHRDRRPHRVPAAVAHELNWQTDRRCGTDAPLAVVLPTYNEAESIAACIKGFEALGIVDDIVVIDNNAHPDTQGEVEEQHARVVVETIQGYGAAIQRGVAETVDADLVCICEPDGTFDPDDILKLLPFTADVDVVFGSRTVRIFILSGANMGLFLKWGNWAVAKLTELLFNTVYLSDVGCTYRVLTRDAVDRLRPGFRDGSAFGYEMMLLTVEQRLPMVQVPVKYQPRVGESSVTGDRIQAFWLGLEMIRMCVRRRIVGR